MQPDWQPFDVLPDDRLPRSPRSIQSPQGIGDRMRSAAFAEIQAREGFLWACKNFMDLSPEMRECWTRFAAVENRHLHLLLRRMEELKIDVRERPVSDRLWRSFMACTSAREFAEFMINAEERGRLSGIRFVEALRNRDPVSAQIVQAIAEEEVEHIQTVKDFFGLELKPAVPHPHPPTHSPIWPSIAGPSKT